MEKDGFVLQSILQWSDRGGIEENCSIKSEANLNLKAGGPRAGGSAPGLSIPELSLGLSSTELTITPSSCPHPP